MNEYCFHRTGKVFYSREPLGQKDYERSSEVELGHLQ